MLVDVCKFFSQSDMIQTCDELGIGLVRAGYISHAQLTIPAESADLRAHPH